MNDADPLLAEVRVLTVRQPWASLIADGRKEYETRTKPTKWRGWVFIHAGAAKTREQRHASQHLAGVAFEGLPLGRVVAIARIAASWRTADVVTMASFGKGLSAEELALGDYTPGRYAWQLQDVHAFNGPALVGKLGLWIPNDTQRTRIFNAYRKSLTP